MYLFYGIKCRVIVFVFVLILFLSNNILDKNKIYCCIFMKYLYNIFIKQDVL